MVKNRITRSTIRKIPTSEFEKIGRVKIGDKTLKGIGLKKWAEKMAVGGKTVSSIREKLRRSGVAGGQCNKRKNIMDVLQRKYEKKPGQATAANQQKTEPIKEITKGTTLKEARQIVEERGENSLSLAEKGLLKDKEEKQTRRLTARSVLAKREDEESESNTSANRLRKSVSALQEKPKKYKGGIKKEETVFAGQGAGYGSRKEVGFVHSDKPSDKDVGDPLGLDQKKKIETIKNIEKEKDDEEDENGEEHKPPIELPI